MHLLYVFPEPLPLPRARGVQVTHFVHALAETGIRVTLASVPVAASPHPFRTIGKELPAAVELLPLQRGLPPPLSKLRMQSNRLFLWRLGRRLERMRAAGDFPDAVLVRHVKLAFGLLRRFPELPLIYEAHEVFAEAAPPRRRRRMERMERAVLERAALVTSISQGAADGLRRHYGLTRAMPLLPSAVDYPATIAAKPWHDAAAHVIYAGSLFPWKGVGDLLDAAAQLPGYRITILGGSAEQIEALRSRIASGGAEVRFTGHLPHHEVGKHLDAACIAVLPNRGEGVSQFTSPLKLFEYMAAGCAVVATDLPAFREVLGADDAAWARDGDPASLAAAIRDTAGNPERAARMAVAGRRIAAGYSWRGRAERLRDLVEEVLGHER
ncbi:MAG TPA: glycosyltransferase family 4 protein [Rhodocyclaceae bacterium]